MKNKYTEEEQKDIARWCEEAIKLYRENVEKHDQTPLAAQAGAMNEVREALDVEMDRVICDCGEPGCNKLYDHRK